MIWSFFYFFLPFVFFVQIHILWMKRIECPLYLKRGDPGRPGWEILLMKILRLLRIHLLSVKEGLIKRTSFLSVIHSLA